MTQQKLAVGVVRWTCKMWVSAVMDIQDHEIMGAENVGFDQGLLSTH
jgi:hypothetical protein